GAIVPEGAPERGRRWSVSRAPTVATGRTALPAAPEPRCQPPFGSESDTLSISLPAPVADTTMEIAPKTWADVAHEPGVANPRRSMIFRKRLAGPPGFLSPCSQGQTGSRRRRDSARTPPVSRSRALGFLGFAGRCTPAPAG